MTNWKPPANLQQRLTSAVRSMTPGTLDGRIANAQPVRNSSANPINSDAKESGLNLLPFTDVFKPGNANTVIFNLTFAPYDDGSNKTSAVHIYWNGVFQRDLSYSLVDKKLTLTDLSGTLRNADYITIKYWYNVDSPYADDVSNSNFLLGAPNAWAMRTSSGDISFVDSPTPVSPAYNVADVVQTSNNDYSNIFTYHGDYLPSSSRMYYKLWKLNPPPGTYRFTKNPKAKLLSFSVRPEETYPNPLEFMSPAITASTGGLLGPMTGVLGLGAPFESIGQENYLSEFYGVEDGGFVSISGDITQLPITVSSGQSLQILVTGSFLEWASANYEVVFKDIAIEKIA